MKLRNRTVWGIPLFLVIILVGIGITAATAAVMYTLSLPATLIVEEPVTDGTYEVKVYSDQACTNELTEIVFSNVYAGSQSEATFYVKNLGSTDIYFEISLIGDYTGSGYDQPGLTNPMTPNEIRKVDFHLTPPIDTEAGTYNFEMVFNVAPA